MPPLLDRTGRSARAGEPPLTPLALRLDSRPLRFLLVGASGYGVSSFVLWLVRQELGMPTVVAGVAAWAISTFTNFLLNDVFTWRDRRSRDLQEKTGRLFQYYGTTIAGLAISLVILIILTDWLHIHLLAANFVAVGTGGTVNYIIHNVWTWRRREL